MRQLLILFSIPLLFGCSSNGDFASHAIEGGPGQPITVAISGLQALTMGTDFEAEREYELQVDVTNLSNLDVTVTRIHIDTFGEAAFRIQPATRTWNQTIDPGEDHRFDLRVRGGMARGFARNESRSAPLRCVVTLANGDSYHYNFEAPVRESF